MSDIFWSFRQDTLFIEQALTIQAAAYAAGDLIGGKLTLLGLVNNPTNPTLQRGGGLIQSVVITDLAEQSTTKDVVFFDTDPINTTFTENAALDIADADLVNVLGVVQVATWFSFADNSVGHAINLALPFVLNAEDALFVAIVERGAPTYVSTIDLTLRIGILPA